MIRHTQTADGRKVLHHDGNGRHHCDGCRAMHRAAGAPQFPHPEHR